MTAVRWNPAGSSSASSPWLIQTWIAAGSPAKSGVRSIFDRDFGVAVFALGRRAHFAAEVVNDEVQPVADAEHRADPRWSSARIGLGRICVVDRRRAAGENNSNRLVGLDFGNGNRTGKHDGEDVLTREYAGR